MLSKKQREELLYSLSSFYRDFLPVDNQLLKLYDIYAKTINYAWDVFGEANDSRFISSTRTLSTIPYFKVDINDAVYDLTTARMLTRMNFEEQIAYLDKEKKYSSFVFTKQDAAGDPSVYGMRLFVDFTDTEPLKLYQDYFLRSNKLYLLPGYIQRKRKAVHYLHAFDVKYNDFTLEKNFGTRFNLEAGPLLPRYEYRDVLEAHMRAFRGDMTIRSLKESIKLATKWESFELEDMKSPTISKQKLKLYEDWIISPNKFLVSLPEILISGKIKINIIRALMSEVKEADKDYMIFFDIDRIDPYIFPMNRYPTISYQRGEKLTPEDDSAVSFVSLQIKDYPLDVAGRYDTVFFYNLNMQYDDPPGNEIVSIKQTPGNFEDTPDMADSFDITPLDSPSFPKNFKANKEESTGQITFSVSSDSAETTQFELYAAANETDEYELVETINNDPSVPTLYFQHQAKDSGYQYYKSRSIAATEPSFFSRVIDVSESMFSDIENIDDTYSLEDSYQLNELNSGETFISYLFDLND